MEADPIFSSPQDATPHVRLEPMPFMRILGLIRKIYTQRFMAYFLPSLLMVLPISLVSTLFSGSFSNQLQTLNSQSHLFQQSSRSSLTSAQAQALLNDYLKAFGPFLSAVLVFIVVALLLQMVRLVVIDGTLTYMTSEQLLGRQANFGQAFAAARKRWAELILGYILFYLILFVISIGLGFLLFLCGLGIGIIVYLSAAFGILLTPVLVLEPGGVGRGLGRSWSLGKGRFWAAIALFAIIYLITLLLTVPIGSLIGLTAGLSATADQLAGTGSATPVLSTPVLLFTGALTGIITAFLAPISLIGYTILYFDARVRLEGFGDSLAVLDSREAHPADIQPPTGLNLGEIKGADLVNVILVTVIGFALLLIYFAVVFSLGTLTSIR